MYKKGELVKHKRTGKLYEVVRGMYTARFMEAQDYEMAAAGWGHMAGLYGGAIDIISLEGDDLGKKRIKQQIKYFTRVND